MKIFNYNNIEENINGIHKGTIILPIKEHGNWRKSRDITSIILRDIREHYLTRTFAMGDILICNYTDEVHVALMCCILSNQQNKGKHRGGFNYDAATMCLRKLHAQIDTYHYPLHVYASTFYTGYMISQTADLIVDIDENFDTMFLYVYKNGRKDDWKWTKLRTALRTRKTKEKK